MATYKIPQQQDFKQINIGDKYGDILASLNVDTTTNKGKIKLARPMKIVANNTTLGGEDVRGFVTFGSGTASLYGVTDREILKSDSPFTSWASDETLSNNAEDITVFDSQIVVAKNNGDIDAYDGTTLTENWWSDIGGGSLPTSSSVPFVMGTIRIGEETLVCTNGSTIRAYTGSISGGGTFTTMDIDNDMTATCVKSTIRRVWIGSKTNNASQAFVYEWDGASTNYTQAYPVGAKAVLAMEIVDNVPIIITERGEIKMLNGAGFTTVAKFPFTQKPVFLDDTETSNIGLGDNIGFVVRPKSMRRVGDEVLIAIETSKDDLPVDEFSPSGIWSLNVGGQMPLSLTHRVSIRKEQISGGRQVLFLLNDSSGRVVASNRNLGDAEREIWLEDLSDESLNYGYIVTSEMDSNSVQDVFSQVVIKALLNGDSSIVVKYRGSKDTSLPITLSGAWSSDKTFVTQEDASYIQTRYESGNADEVEVLWGAGSSRLAHITSVENNGSTYEIHIDRSIGTVGEDAIVRVDNWKKIPETMTSSDGEVKRLGLDLTSSWCQLKIGIEGSAGYPEIREILVFTNNKEGK